MSQAYCVLCEIFDADIDMRISKASTFYVASKLVLVVMLLLSFGRFTVRISTQHRIFWVSFFILSFYCRKLPEECLKIRPRCVLCDLMFITSASIFAMQSELLITSLSQYVPLSLSLPNITNENSFRTGGTTANIWLCSLDKTPTDGICRQI
jgi:hypothetical protein